MGQIPSGRDPMQYGPDQSEVTIEPMIPAADAHRHLDMVLRRVDQVSTLPHVILDILRVANDPLADVRDLTRVIEMDPALAARVMRCTNSAYHGLRNPIRDLTQAVNYLGFNQVRNLAISASVCQLFKNDVVIGSYSRRGLWDHMVSVAVTARLIAQIKELPNPDEIYLAGLLHDLGIVIEDQYCHGPFSAMLTHYPVGRTLCQAEKMYLGFDHTMLGFCVAERWKLPDGVCAAIALHHRHRYHGPHAATVACVELANVMCTTKGVRSVGVPITHLSPSVLSHLKLQRGEIHELAIEMNRQLDRHQSLFGLVAAA